MDLHGRDIMTTFILIRHGQSVANLNLIFAGHYDADLSELGHKQAKCTADAVVGRFKIDKIYSSDLLRAYNTARPISEATGVGIVPDMAFREIFAGEWEGRPFEELKEVYKEDFFVWRNDICNSRCTGGESMVEVGERFCARVKELAAENDGKTVVITTHAAAIRAFMATCTGDIAEMNRIAFVPNASYSVLTVDGERFEFVEKGHDEHLGDHKTVLPPNV